jgi:hypothetical protein
VVGDCLRVLREDFVAGGEAGEVGGVDMDYVVDGCVL